MGSTPARRLATPAGAASPTPSDHPLYQRYQVGMFDLDGVIYVSGQIINVAAATLQAATHAGMQVGFVTNNASRSAEDVAQLLTQGGIAATPAQVVTSAQAAAAVLARMLPAGASVLIVGADALAQAVAELGLRPVAHASEQPAAVVQGFSPTMDNALLTEAVLAINAGAPWVLTNDDLTIPIARGLAPGNGAFAALVHAATGVQPVAVAGKPNREQMDLALHRFSVVSAVVPQQASGAHPASVSASALFVGDRLDTDMAAAAAVSIDSLAVLTGVSTPVQIVLARGAQRPTYVADSVHGLTQPLVPIAALHPAVPGDAVGHGGWQASVESARLVLTGVGTPADATTATCALLWPLADAGHPTPDLSALDNLR